MTQAEKKKVIKRLVNFKNNYNFTSKQIAELLQTTQSAVSNWFTGKSLPRKDKVEEIQRLFNKYCIPGIIRIPKNKHWLASFFLRVEDIKDPYGSWVDDNWSGEAPEVFAKWVKDWEQTYPTPHIYRAYQPNIYNQLYCKLETLNLNTTIQLREMFIGHASVNEAFAANRGLRRSEFDEELAQSLVSGEDDGTS